MHTSDTIATAPAGEYLVRIEGLRKSFGDLEVLRDVNLDIAPGEVVTIIGASGSGKSTLLRCINLLEAPDAGHVWFQGSDLTADHVDVNGLREDIGMVFQGFNLFNNMDVLANCTLAPVTRKKMTREEAQAVALGHLRSMGLEGFAHAAPSTLSGGQKQRLCIARALAVEPEVLLMDEPTSALDPISTSKVEELATELKENYTIVMVTHNMQQAARISDKTAFFLLGELVEMGPTERVFATPVDKRTEDYISGRFG